LPPDTTDQLSVIIQETASSPKPSGTKTYAVSMPPTTTPLVGVEMTLTVSNATSVTTKSRSFTVSENLKETGWKSMANTTNSASQSYSSDSDSEVKNSRSTSTTIGLSFLNLGTEGWLSTEPLELGTITIAPVDVKTAPQFTLTHKSSSAFTKDGKTLPLHLVVAPKMTE
jgi:hypothetical protein